MLHGARRVASWPSTHEDAARKSSISFQNKREKCGSIPQTSLLSSLTHSLCAIHLSFFGKKLQEIFISRRGKKEVVSCPTWACASVNIQSAPWEMGTVPYTENSSLCWANECTETGKKIPFFQEGFGTCENKQFSCFTFNRLESWPREARKIIKIRQ